MEIIQKLIPVSKYPILSHKTMDNPTGIIIHNTYNTASARQEIKNMTNNNKYNSFHIAVDDKECVQGIPFNRTSYSTSNAEANLSCISIEICYSKDYETERYYMAEIRAIELVRYLMNYFNISIENVRQHNHWTGKDCPHRIREEGRWETFIALCKKKETEDVKMGFIKGYQVLKWLGQTIHCYMQRDDQDLGMMSATGNPDYRALQVINMIDDNRTHHCKVNSNYFEMQNASIYGQHYGVEITPQNDFAPKHKEWLALWLDKFNKLHYSLASDFWLGKEDVKFACSPATIMLHNGKDLEEYSTASGKAKITTANTQTLLMQLKTGEFVLAVVSGKLNGYQCRDFAKSYGATHMSMFDSGGSSQMIVDGAKKVYTGRKIANVLTLFKKVGELVPTPDPTPSDVDTINVASLGLRIRKELKFSNGKPTGEVIGFIPVGDKATLVDTIDNIQADGYQWVAVEYNGIKGFSQYDSMHYWIKLNDDTI